MLKSLAILAAMLAVSAPIEGRPVASVPTQDVPLQEVPAVSPNVLVIVTDDQRVDTMDAMPRTARLFAEQGVTFPNAFATTPLCCPSRASIMTGLYAHNHNVETQTRAGSTLDVGLTMQRYLSESNYYTGIIGKWLNGWNLSVSPPYLNEVAIFTSAGKAYTDAMWNVDGNVREVPGYSTEFMLKRARGFLERAETIDERPWFLLVTPPQPHSPFQPQKAYAGERFGPWQANPAVGEADKSDKPPWIEDKKAGRYLGRRVRAKQLRTLRSVDDLIAETFKTMRALGESADTIAIFTSDNGYLWGEHGLVDIKRYPYTPSVRVPLYLRWPQRVVPSTVDERLAGNIDIAPTVLEAAGNVNRAAQLDGRSLLQASGRTRILLEYWTGDGNPLGTWASLRTHDYQYIEYYSDTGAIIYREYYDIIEDPFQLENLLDNSTVFDDPEWVTISNDLEQARACSGATCP